MPFWTAFAIELGKFLAVGITIGVFCSGSLRLIFACFELRPVRGLSKLSCLHCNELFGIGAARAAKAEFDEDLARAYRDAERESGGSILIDPDSWWLVQCPVCQESMYFDSDSFSLATASPRSTIAPLPPPDPSIARHPR
jgi:hypothetical protein